MTESTTEIDIVVPYFGDRSRLEETVHSVLRQRTRSWRLVVVEDGDQHQGVGDWLRGLDDPRVHHVLNGTTQGIPRNFQNCLSMAEAPYVVFPGCDDRLLEDYVSHVLELVHRFPGAAAYAPGVRVIDRDGAARRSTADLVKNALRPRHRAPRLLAGEPLLTSLMHGNWAYFPAICWRRRTIADIGFREDLPTTLDLRLLSDVVLRGNSLAISPRTEFEYRRHRESISSVAAVDAKRFPEERQLFAELTGACLDRGWTRAARAASWHLTSRSHAALLIPGRIAARERNGVRVLLRHLVSRR